MIQRKDKQNAPLPPHSAADGTAESEPESLEEALARRAQRLRRLHRQLLAGPGHPVYRALVLAWTLAILARATLAQVSGPGWWTAQILLFAGAALLLRWGGRAGWLLSLAGLLIPLLFLRCWMTQTTLLTAIATVGLLTTRGDPEPAHDEDDAGAKTARVAGDAPPVVPFAGALVIGTYLVAVFHKLNRDYFDADLSCAVYGWQKLDRLTPVLPLPDVPDLLLHTGVLGAELLIAWLLWRRAMRSALVVGALFHLPLTIALAPAFVFTMGIGFAARMRPDQVAAFDEGLRRHGRTALLLGALAAALTTWSAGVWPIWHLLVKIVLLVAVAWIALRMEGPAAQTRGPAESCTAQGRAPRRRRSPWSLAALGLMVLLASTPYLGTRVQHAGAMLSNLRIDEGCWNHLLVPEAVRRADPYVRIDVARVGGDAYRARGLHERREAALTGGLWGDDALLAVRRNWCRPHTRPIRLEGTHRGTRFVIEDLCDEAAVLPRARGAFGGAAWFPGHLRFQTTLSRDCRQRCVH